MKKILYVWKGPYPWDIRAEKFCKTLFNAGFDVSMLARWNGEETEESEFEFRVFRAGYKKRKSIYEPIPFNLFWKQSIKQAINRFSPDLIIVREFFLVLPVVNEARKKDIPVIFDMAEYYPEAMRGWKKYYDSIFWRMIVHYLKIPDYFDKKAMKISDGIITVCEELSSRVKKVSGKTDYEIEIVHNTPEKSFFTGISFGTKYPPKIFAYHGHFSLDRNLDKLVIGFIKAAEIDRNIELVLAGTGENFDEIDQIVNESSFADRIHLLGAYDFSQIKQLYSETDIAILPYKSNQFINHTISNKLFDYLGAGKPIIVSQAEPMVRIINETQAGIICNCENEDDISKAIISMKNMDLKSFSQAGRKAFEDKYNWDVDSANLIKFIERYM